MEVFAAIGIIVVAIVALIATIAWMITFSTLADENTDRPRLSMAQEIVSRLAMPAFLFGVMSMTASLSWQSGGLSLAILYSTLGIISLVHIGAGVHVRMQQAKRMRRR